MKFSIGTASSSMEFEETLKLIKSSLMYADEVELIGMAEYAIYNYFVKCLTGSKNIENIFENLISLLQAFDNNEAQNLMKQINELNVTLSPFKPLLKRKRHRTKQEIFAQMKMRQFEEECNELLNNMVDELLHQKGTKDIQNLIEREIISVFDYSYSEFSTDGLAGSYFANLLAIMKHRTSYPLFDSISADIVKAVIENDKLDFSQTDKEVIRHAGVANSILQTLPTLEKASIDEILDFKKDLKVPLDNFRCAIYEFSEKIIGMPWDDDFQYECLKLYNTEVIPKVTEINELSSETSVLKNFGARVLADGEERRKLGFVGAGLATTITTGTNMLDALGLLENVIRRGAKIGLTTAGVAAILKTADLYRQAHKEVKERKTEMAGNVMYYYYRASQNIK